MDELSRSAAASRSAGQPTDRVRVRRFGDRASYDRSSIFDILDAGLLCHVAFDFRGSPAIIPTLYWRDDDWVYLHGSAASRMLRAIEGQAVSIAVTLLDGLVFTRSAFHHSANYRSVVIYGTAEPITSSAAKLFQLRRMMDKISPGRWDRLRPVKRQELKATRVMRVPLNEASAKIRMGQASEDADDLAWAAWGGVVPIRCSADAPIADNHCVPTLDPPALPTLLRSD